MSESRIKELANAGWKWRKSRYRRPELRDIGDRLRRVAGSEDPDAVRSRVDATQVNAYDREDVVQATLPTGASRIHSEFGSNEIKCKGSTLVIKCWLEKCESRVREMRNRPMGTCQHAVEPISLRVVCCRSHTLNTKIMPPMVLGREMIEGHHLSRRNNNLNGSQTANLSTT